MLYCKHGVRTGPRPIEGLQLIASNAEPKHGRWLNMAEIELSALGRQCLDRRLGTLEEVQQEVAAWQHERNGAHVTIDWRFTTADARIKLKRLYPVLK